MEVEDRLRPVGIYQFHWMNGGRPGEGAQADFAQINIVKVFLSW